MKKQKKSQRCRSLIKKKNLFKNEPFLYKGLPVLRVRGKSVIYSPYTRSFAELDDFKNIQHYCFPANFFGTPSFTKYDQDIVSVGFILTRKCNLNCSYCVAYTQNREYKDITQNIIIDALNFVLAEKKPKKIIIKISGGEPTLHFRAIQWIVDEVKKKKINHLFVIATNGVIPASILDYLISNDFLFQISFDGMPEINSKYRLFKDGKPATNFTLNTIKQLVQKKCRFKIRSTITSETACLLPNIVNYYADLGIKYIAFGTLGPCFRSAQSNLQPPEFIDFVSSFLKALDVAEERNVSLEIPANLFHPCFFYCSNVSGEELIFTNEGLITRCWFVLDKDNPLSSPFIIGEYDLNRRSFVLNSDNIVAVNNLNVNNIEFCKDCFAKFLCAGGCRARHISIEQTSKLTAVSKLNCNISKKLIERLLVRMYYQSKSKRTENKKL